MGNAVDMKDEPEDNIYFLGDHYLVSNATSALYKSEENFEEEVFSYLAGILENKVVSAIVFGSTTRHEEAENSGFDICCIVKKIKDKEELQSLLNQKCSPLYGEFGVGLSPVIFTFSEAKTKSNTSILGRITKRGVP